MEKRQTQSRSEIELQKLRQIVLDNIQNEQFGVEDLAQTYGISRSQLHRKLRKLTKRSISRFIREIRLDEAHEMLREDMGTVSEIAYKVGFSSPTYFNTCFSEYFGYPPGETKYHKEKEPATSSNEPIVHTRGRKPFLIGIAAVLVLALVWLAFRDYQNSTEPIAEDKIPVEKSIAVLPFEDISTEMDQEAFTNAMMIEVINHLVQLKELKVTSRASTFSYRGTQLRTREIAKELGVSHILLGSVQKEHEKVRITVQLVDGDLDRLLWSETYDGQLTNVLDMQSIIAKQVADELMIRIGPDVNRHISKVPTKNMTAYSKYLDALGNFGNTETNLQLYSEAIALDPDFSEAYTGLATEKLWAAYASKIVIDNVDVYIGEIKDLLFKSMKLDPNNARAYDLLGSTLVRFDWDFEKGEYYLKKAQELNPSSADSEYVLYLLAVGRFEDALTYNTYGVIPFKPNLFSVWLDQGLCYVYLNQPEKVRECIQIAMDREGTSNHWHPGLYRLLCYLQDYEKVITKFESVSEKEEFKPMHLAMVAIAYWNSGKLEKTQDLLHKIKLTNTNTRINSPAYYAAVIYSQTGESDLAITSLNKSFQNREIYLHWLKVDPLLDPIRSDPRFVELYNKLEF